MDSSNSNNLTTNTNTLNNDLETSQNNTFNEETNNNSPEPHISAFRQRRSLMPLPYPRPTLSYYTGPYSGSTNSTPSVANIPEIIERLRSQLNIQDEHNEHIVLPPLVQQITQTSMSSPSSIPYPINTDQGLTDDKVEKIKEIIKDLQTFKASLASTWEAMDSKLELARGYINLLQDELTNKTNKCKVCYSNEANILLLPCSHLGLCKQCHETVNNQVGDVKCPFCRTSSRGYINIIIP